jgi:DNA-binding NarL/FixJ family response regulator
MLNFETVKKVVVVDDHQLIAKAISSIVEDFNDFEVLYEVENGKCLMEKFNLKENIPDIVLLDVSMPVMNGFETAKWLKENHKEVLVMALSVQDDDESLIKMIQNGAKGYLHKNVHPMDLEFALKELIKNGIYFPTWATSKMFNSIENPNAEKKVIKNEDLSNREIEFLTFVCQDLTYKEIGEKMCCSPRTIDGYRDTLFEKLDLHSRVALALYAVKNDYYKI